ncbi:MAG: serine/threonine-protein kinase [Planctomycetota bacterium]|nr:serine/threonine-protein kinase [Planctomycetota bacterium]
MDPDRYDELAVIFDQVLDLPDGAQMDRVRELTQDPEIVGAMQDLLAAHRDGDLPTRGTGLVNDLNWVPPAGPMDPMPPQLQGYTIIKSLGHGASGTVYLAQAPLPLKRKVAIKMLNVGTGEHTLARFHEEQRVLAQLQHTGIAEVYDQGTTESNRPFTVLEFVDGQSITEYCKTHPPTWRRIVELVAQCTRAVGHAHQRNIIHRDLKPSNLMVTQRNGKPHMKVIDFGTAKSTDPLRDGPHLTADSQFIGTLSYSSAEQLSGSDTPDTRTDVHALGLVLYECLEGKHPFLDGDCGLSTTIDRIMSKAIPPVTGQPGLPTRELDAILAMACAKDISERYSSMLHFGEDLQNLLDGLPVRAMRPRPAYIARKFIARNRMLLGAVSLVLVMLATLAGIAIDRGIQANRNRDALKDTAIGLVDDVMPQLADLNGSTEVRTQLAASMNQRIDELLATDPMDRELRRRKAHLLEYSSDLHLANQQVEHAGALRTESARIIAELKREKSEERLQADERRLLIKLGDIAKSRQNFSLAREYYESTHSLLLATPGDHRSGLCWSYERLAHIAHKQQRPADHRKFGQQRLDLALELLGENPGSAAQLHNCAMAHQAMAEIEHSTNHSASAVRNARQALSMATKLVALEPNRFSARVMELTTHVIVMRSLYYADKLREGDQQAGQVRQLAVQLVALNPSREDAIAIASNKLQQVIDLWSLFAPARDPSPVRDQLQQLRR